MRGLAWTRSATGGGVGGTARPEGRYQAPGSITLEVDQRTLESESAPAFFNPQLVPDERLQRATREHYGYG
jgi:hypothetical protein